MSKRAIVIGAGFSGMAAAACLAQNGWQVDLIDKHSTPGGRCRQFEVEGFHFDMGPSWYWMPDVFEKFYARFNHQVEDFYQLDRLDPSYQVIFPDETVQLPASFSEMLDLFESWEKGSSKQLIQFLDSAQYKYDVGMTEFVYKPSFSILEFMDIRIAKSALGLNMFSSIQKEIHKRFKHANIRQLLEFPVLFLGAKPQDTPALYSLMNYADIKLGTWYPRGGMVQISKAFASIAEEQGVNFHLGQEVKEFMIEDNKAVGVVTGLKKFEDYDIIISGADYHHTEQLLPQKYRNYNDGYWARRKMAPSSLLVYLGVNEKIPNLLHHNLFFDADFSLHAEEIYDNPKWPSNPLFYACVPSKTDTQVAPLNCENIFLLMPIAPGIEESEEIHEKYLRIMIERLKDKTGVDVTDKILYKKMFGVRDFMSEYNSFKGNAYGLANTLKQTAFLKPTMRNKQLKNLYYCGQLTVPGPGVPPSIISGQVIADYIAKKI